MDLVKIGFLIQTDGLAKANKEVDALLTKVDQLGKKPVSAGNTQKATAQYQAVNTAADRMIEKQKTLSQLLPYMDKQTANLASGFWLVSKEANAFNGFLDLITKNKALDLKRKEEEALAKTIANTGKVQEAARQKEMQARQNEYQKSMNLAEKARQENLAAVQKQYQAEMDAAAKASANKAALEEAARVKRFKAEQDQYQKDMAAAKKAADAQEALRQKQMQARQNEYQKTQAAVKAAADKEIAATKAVNDHWNTSVQLQEKIAKYQQQGLSYSNASKMAKMEISGADINTLNQYRQALDSVNASTVRNNTSQIASIAKYALLSAVIYGTMTATLALAAATVKTADEYTSIQNRMKMYIKDTDELAKVNAQMAQFATENNVGLRETSTLFARLQPAMQKIGANTAAVTSVVDAFGKSMRIGGATAQEAASATLQFSQAMASGKLAGDEFRAISEASPRFLKAIADGSGIAAEKLKKMSSEGMLTTEVISKALLKEYPRLIEENKRLGVSLEQGTNAIKTAFTVLIGEFNEGAGVTRTLGEVMLDFSQGLLTTAQSARETGASISKWFSDNANTISAVVEAVKILAAVFAARYVVAIALARVESMKLASSLLAVQAAQNGVTRTTMVMTTAVTAAGNAAKAALAFFGGWVGVGLTIASVAASFLLLGNNAKAATPSLAENSATVAEAVENYKKLSAVQQQAALSNEKARLQEVNAEYAKLKDRVVQSAFNLDRHNDMTTAQTKSLQSLALGFRDGKVTLDALTKQVSTASYLSEESKKKFLDYAASLETTGQKATTSEKLIAILTGTVVQSGNAAAIAGSQFNQLIEDAKASTLTNKEALTYMGKYGLNQSNAVKLAKAATEERRQGKNSVDAMAKALKEEQDSTDALGASKKAAAQAEKEANKQRNEAARDLKKFTRQVTEMATYYNVLQATHDVEIARIASQKEYIAIYKDNLAVAKDLAEVQEKINQSEARDKYEESLQVEAELQDRIVKLMKVGAAYDLARTVASAKFTDDLRGRAVAELSMANAAYAQNMATKSQAEDYRVINTFLEDGYTLEQAIFKVQLARMRALSSDKNKYDDLEASYEANLKEFELQKAKQESQAKLNEALREATKLTVLTAGSYDAAYVAAAKLAAVTRGLTQEQALAQLVEEEKKAVVAEEVDYYQKLLVLASSQEEAVRSASESYKTLSDEAKNHVALQRQNLKLVEDYVASLKDAEQHQLGNFDSVNFDAFGDFGNPFKEALDGANAYLATLTELDRNMQIVTQTKKDLEAQKADAKTQADLENINKLIVQQGEMEAKYAEDKKKANQIVFGQSLTLAKSFFKEESKGYKLISGLEKAYQASVIAFKLWEKKDQVQTLAMSIAGYVKDGAAFIASAASKAAAQMGLNTLLGTQAVLTQGSGDPYTAFGRMAAMAAIVTGLGIAVGSVSGGGGSESAPTSNQGTGTVFGGKVDDKSESIVKAMEILADNSELGLPISSAMLASLRNIESSLSGVANLIIRGEVGTGLANSVNTNSSLGIVGDNLVKLDSKVTSILSLGLDKITGLDVGGFAGNLLSSVIGGIFGKKSSSVTGQGLVGSSQSLGSILDGGINLSEYADVATTKKSWFGSKTNYSTKYGEADKGIKDQFNLIFSNMYDSILGASSILGKDLNGVSDKLKSYIVNIGKIDVKGLSGTEIQEKLEAVFGAEADKIAQYAVTGLEDFQKVGEGYYETLVRVASGVETAGYYTDRLNVDLVNYNDIVNKQGDVAAELVRQSVLAAEGTNRVVNGFYDLVASFDGTAEDLYGFINTLRDLQDAMYVTGKSGDYLTSTMILAAGGADNLRSGLEAYFDMLSTQEQATELTRRMTNEFASLGVALPDSIQAYKDLINSIDITSDSGQKLYGAIIALAPEFTDLQDAIQKVKDEAQAAADEAAKLAKEQADAAEKLAKEQADAVAKLAEEAAKLAEEAKKAAEELAALIKEATGYTTSLRIVAVAYEDVANKTGNAATEILRASMLANLGSAALAGGFYDLVEAFDGSASELYSFIVSMREVKDAIFVTGQDFKNVTQAMLNGSDGISNLSSALNAFFDFLTPVEKADELTRRMTNSFGELGFALPDSIEAFRALVTGLDTSTASGQELFGQLIVLSSDFATLQEALKVVKDANEEAAKAIEEANKAAAEAAAEAAKAAEEAAAEAKRLADEAKAALDALGTAYFITGQSLSSLTQVMADAAGGTEELSAGLNAMYEMLSPTEKASELTRRLVAEFENLGLTLPESTKSFRDLVAGIDTTTTTGQALLGQVIALAPEFNDLQSALESATSEVDSLIQSLLGLASTAGKALGETNQTQNLVALRTQFEMTSLLAMQGDADAANRLLELGQSLLDVSKTYSVSSSDYAKDLALIQQTAVEVAAAQQEIDLGYNTTANLNSVPNTSPTTITTSNNTTDAKLDKLREDMIIAINAVAKYTQNTANRLERWDYGDRMNVRVEQDPTDDPIKVTTV